MKKLPKGRSGREAKEVAIQAAREAGELIMARFRKLEGIRYKGRRNIVTEADLQAEKRIQALIGAEFPLHQTLCEEGGQSGADSEYIWVVDPLDGTRNYAAGIPHFCVSLALAEGGEVVLGVIYDPSRGELFYAERGKGAHLDGAPINVSRKTRFGAAVVGLDLGYHEGRGLGALEVASALWPGVGSFRVMGSAALGLAYAACGRFDLYFHHFVYPWDLAAGQLLVREAGGIITQRDGSPCTLESKDLVAANRSLHRTFLTLVSAKDLGVLE